MPRVSKLQICVLMFLHAFALGAYLVPLPTVMTAHGMTDYITVPLITASVAAFISPLIFGSLADRKYAPERLLGIVALGGSILMGVAGLTLHYHMGAIWFLVAMGAYYFWAAPGWGLLTAIGLMNVDDPQREFAPLRVWATIGFMVGAAFVSFVLGADRSPTTTFLAAGFFFVESIYCFMLPPTKPAAAAAPKRLRDYFGWDAIQLLKQRNHRMIFLTSALFSIPLASFYPYASKHLDSLGIDHPSGVLSVAQLSEIVGMYGLAAIMGRFPLKWLIIAVLVCGIIRYSLFSTNNYGLVVTGIVFHGLIFIFFSMTTQIYLEQRVEHSMRNQAQALLLVMNGGIGNLSGYLLGTWLYQVCLVDGKENWTSFWGILTIGIIAVSVFFLVGYRGLGKREEKTAPETTNPI